MGLFDSLLGVGKLAANLLGGGSGSKSTTNKSESSKGTTTANRREYSDGMLQILESTAANSLVGGSQAADALTAQIDKIKGAGLSGNPITFDSDAYIRDVMASVDNSLGASLRQNRNQAVAGAGGSTAGNSAAALLANRMEADNAAQRAGVMASTTATAKELESNLRKSNADSLASETGMLSSIDSNLQAGLATLLNALRGGETYQEVKESTTTSGTGTTKTPFNWTAGLGNLFKDIGQD